MSEPQINITLPDGSVRQVPGGSSGMDIALQISEGWPAMYWQPK